MTLKWRHTVLLLAWRERASAMVVVCYARRVQNALVSSYECLKFATQHVDFWAPYKTGRNYAETRSYAAVLSKAERSERDSCGVLW